MLYLLEATLYSGILYAVYLLVLRNNTAHSWNRAYLLLCASLPVLLPFVYVPGVGTTNPLYTAIQSFQLPEITITPDASGKIGATGLSANALFTVIYLSVAALLFLRFVYTYWSVMRFLVRKEHTIYAGNVKVITDSGYGPGSFGMYIFFPGKEVADDILQHELAHIQRRHSYDLVFIKLLQCIFWPNVMLYVIMKELKIIHEFEADVHAPADKEQYIRSLLNGIFHTRRFSLSHTFFHNPIKRRIVMLQKTPQSRSSLRKTITGSGIIAASLIAGVVYLQSCKQPTEQELIAQTLKNEPAPPKNSMTKDGKTYEYVEQMPESSVDIPTFLGENIKYPEESKKNKIEGRVIVKFIVDEEGNVTSPTVMKSPDQATGAEAVRVIQMMPKWKPGKDKGKNVAVYFTLPISFKLG